MEGFWEAVQSNDVDGADDSDINGADDSDVNGLAMWEVQTPTQKVWEQ